MNVLVVHAHPAEDSFVTHLRHVAAEALDGAGHRIDVADIYRFPVDDPSGWAEGAVAAEQERLQRADALVLVYPTWWGGPPALLTSWLERVLPGAPGSVARSDDGSRPLRNLRRLAVVTTHGSPHWVNRLQGEPGRCTTMRAVRSLVHPRARCQWLACYGLDRIGEPARVRFAARVRRKLARW